MALTRLHKTQLHFSPVYFYLEYVGYWSDKPIGLYRPSAEPLPRSESYSRITKSLYVSLPSYLPLPSLFFVFLSMVFTPYTCGLPPYICNTHDRRQSVCGRTVYILPSERNDKHSFYVLLTVYFSITLVINQLNAQNLVL